MTQFTVQVLPVGGLISNLQELKRLGEMSQLLGYQSKYDLAIRKVSTTTTKVEETWLEFPKDILDRKILESAIDARILVLVKLVKKHYKIDLCNVVLLINHE